MTIIGIKSPFQKGSTSFPAVIYDDEVIRSNIFRILQTPKGARVMRPNYGSNVWSFIFENRGPLLRARLDNEVRRALASGEPRITVIDVSYVEEKNVRGETFIIVTIVYMVNSNISKTAVPYGPVP